MGDRRSIELPPGWHDVMTALLARSGVALKYLYAAAIDGLLAKGDFDVIKDEAWILDESARTNLDAVGARYPSSMVQKWTPKPRLAETRRSRSRRKQ